jgi:CRP-like cAMP-binding protein
MHARSKYQPTSLSASALADYRAGVPLAELLRTHGINASSLYRHLKARGLPRRNNYGANRLVLSPEDVAAYASGRDTSASLGARLGVWPHEVTRALRRQGVALRAQGPSPGHVFADGSRQRKLTQEQEAKIARLLEDRITHARIAEMMGVTRQRISQLAARRH